MLAYGAQQPIGKKEGSKSIDFNDLKKLVAQGKEKWP